MITTSTGFDGPSSTRVVAGADFGDPIGTMRPRRAVELAEIGEVAVAQIGRATPLDRIASDSV